MLFLSGKERRDWARYAQAAFTESLPPDYCDLKIRKNLVSAFHFYVATYLAAKGEGAEATGWLESGTLTEEDGLFGCGFLLGFLNRHGCRLEMPAVPFDDPRPFIHFAGVPVMKVAREQFIRQCGHTLPAFDRPIRFMDIGCGDGALTATLLNYLVTTGKVPGIREVLLIDSSPAMAALAEATVGSAFPDADVCVENSRIQNCSATINQPYDIAMSSLAYHHMPLEQKRVHLTRLMPWIDHLILFEMDANNDTPDLYSPDLALSIYQSYSRIIDFIFTHDAPVDLAIDCVDSLMMAEIVSLLTKPRGDRLDYHMLRGQWHALFQEVLGPVFSCRCDSPAYADEYMDLFTLHYGRDRS